VHEVPRVVREGEFAGIKPGVAVLEGGRPWCDVLISHPG